MRGWVPVKEGGGQSDDLASLKFCRELSWDGLTESIRNHVGYLVEKHEEYIKILSLLKLCAEVKLHITENFFQKHVGRNRKKTDF